MKYNYKKIKDEVEKLVKQACYAKGNYYSETVWEYHILLVVNFCLILGKKLKADLEVLELAAFLHDYGSFFGKQSYKQHHINSAEAAEKILSKLNFPVDKIKNVKGCIASHRASIASKKTTIEAKILASADAMGHISELADMFYLAYGVHKYKTEEGAKWLKRKLERSWKKIIPEGKKMIGEDYEIAMKVLDKVISKQ